MKYFLYITANKIWVNEHIYDWDGISFDDVLGKIKKELRLESVRVILGNDISFVTAVKAEDTFLSRENVLKMVKSWMPFEIADDCFGWKEVVLASKEVWVQIVALEKELLMSLSSAVLKHGIKVDLVTAIGVLLGEKTKGREVPVIIRWNDMEKLSVVAVNGLTDLVVSGIAEEDLMTYATRKWGLAVNPETILLSNKDFNLSENVFSEKNKGEDSVILNLPILKEVVAKKNPEEKTLESDLFEKETEKKPKAKLWFYFLVLVIAAGAVVYKAEFMKSVLPAKTAEVVAPSVSPTVEVTATPSVVDFAPFKVQVLNGSGVTGEAAKIKVLLVENGFVSVDTGNTTATAEGVIRSKIEVPKAVTGVAEKSTTSYKMGLPDALAPESRYDLIVVLGSAKKTILY